MVDSVTSFVPLGFDPFRTEETAQKPQTSPGTPSAVFRLLLETVGKFDPKISCGMPQSKDTAFEFSRKANPYPSSDTAHKDTSSTRKKAPEPPLANETLASEDVDVSSSVQSEAPTNNDYMSNSIESAPELTTESLENPTATLTCFRDLCSEGNIAEVYKLFQAETPQGAPPYVIIDTIRPEDTHVSVLLAGATDSLPGIKRETLSPTSTSMRSTYLNTPAKSSADSPFFYPEMTPEDHALELLMSTQEGNIFIAEVTDLDPKIQDLPVMTQMMSEPTKGPHTSNQTFLQGLGKITARPLDFSNTTRSMGNVVRLPSPQSFKTELFEQFRVGMMHNLLDQQTEFSIQLRPESLGQISVQLQFKDSHLHAHVTTMHPDTHQLFQKNPDLVYRIVQEAADVSNMTSFSFDLNQQNPNPSPSSDDAFPEDTLVAKLDESSAPLQWLASDRLLDKEI